MGVTQVFNAAGVDRERFLDWHKKNPKTYKDWDGDECNEEWKQETTGKEGDLPSPFLSTEFKEAADKGLIEKEDINMLCGSWSGLSEAGEATNLNLVHLNNLDILDVNDLTKAEIKGRAGVKKALTALKGVVPGFENAKLRNIGMKIGTRDSRKIVGRYNLTEHDVKN